MMKDSVTNSRYFWLLNLIVIMIVFGISAKMLLHKSGYSEYRLQLDEVTHFVTPGFSLEADLTNALEIPAGGNVGGTSLNYGRHIFLRPGGHQEKEFTITAVFDYTDQYDALMAAPNVVPGIMLPGLGDNYIIYLNGHIIASEWHVDDGSITMHKLARGTVYPINPIFFNRGENILTFRIYGDPTTFDTGLTVTSRYVIDNFSKLNIFDYFQIAFAGICLAVAIVFMIFYILFLEKKMNLWFSLTALSISLYTFFRVGAFQGIIKDYELALRLEVLTLFTFTYFTAVLIYTCSREKFSLDMKVYRGIYIVFFAAVFLPGHQFVLDLIKVFFILFIPYIIYIFISSLFLPIMREIKDTKSENDVMFQRIIWVLSKTLRGNMLVGAFMPIVIALFDQIAYVIFSYQAVVLSQYGFLFFFANITFAIASDNAKMHNKLMVLSEELRMLVKKRESELMLKSGEVEEAKTTQINFIKDISREIRAPLSEIIGAIELRLLGVSLSDDTKNWLRRMLLAQQSIRKNLDTFLGVDEEHAEAYHVKNNLKTAEQNPVRAESLADSGGMRHLFVINPKSFITLKDLKNFLLSIEMCFSTGHRAEYKIYISRYPRDAYSAVHRYLSSSPVDEITRVYGVGGDGILFDCLNGMASFPNAELAPIPYGNANDFVRSFGKENIELFRNIKLMSKAPSRLVDMILCREQYALCSCSVGIEARAVQIFAKTIEQINSGKARSFVPLIYKLGAVKALIDNSRNNVHYSLTIDGVDMSGKYLFINIGNIALNGGGNMPNPLAVPDDGFIDIITCTSLSIFNSLRVLLVYTSGNYNRFPDYFKHYRAKEVHCKSDELMSVILDGETLYTHEVEIKILPKAVKIVSPNGIGFFDFSQSVKGALDE